MRERVRLSGIGGSGKDGGTDGFGGELGLTLSLEAAIGVVFEKASLVESVEKLLFDGANLDLSGEPNELRAKVERGLVTVEAVKSGNKDRRNEQGGVGIMVGIADVETRFFRIARRHEIQVKTQ